MGQTARLTVDIATQFTWTYCLRIDATEAGTVSECNYFTSINGYDAGGMYSINPSRIPINH